MARNRQDPDIEIEVEGEPYLWRLHVQPQWSSDVQGFRGMVIAARHRDGQREALMEFPPGPQPRFGAAQLHASQIPPAKVARAIASAVTAGWEPLSRGKTVTVVVDADGG